MTELKGSPSLASVIVDESRPLAAIAAWFVAVAVASGIWWNVPLIDDWTYAWSVERLLATGRFEVLDWSGNFAVGQVVWGTAWAAVLGFSFVALRLSTLALGLAGCVALYLMLRDFDVSRSVALLGALTLAANPAFVVLSASFMTDVPFTACATLALLFYTRAARFGRPQSLWWAGWWAFAAFTVRHVGVVVPLAGAPLLLTRGQLRTIRPLTVSVALGATWTAMAVLWLTLDALVGTTSVMTGWVEGLGNVFLVKAASYLSYNIDLLVAMAVFLLPALIAAGTVLGIWRSRAFVAAAIVALVILFGVFGGLPLPLAPSETWNLREIGASRSLVSGSMWREPDWVRSIIRLAGLLAFTSLAALVVRCLVALRIAVNRLAKAGRFAILDAFSARAASPAGSLLAFVAAYIGIVNLFWLYNDRYYLALIPPAATLILAGLPAGRKAPRLAWAAVGLFAAIGLVGSRDAFRFNVAIREGWETLVGAGVAPSDIDAGYAWNGWVLYAHPEHLAAGLTPQDDVPWVTSWRESKYLLSKTPVKGYDVERAIAWTDLPWPGPDQLLVLRRRSDTRDK